MPAAPKVFHVPVPPAAVAYGQHLLAQELDAGRAAWTRAAICAHEAAHALIDSVLGTEPRRAVVYFSAIRGCWTGYVVPTGPTVSGRLESLSRADLGRLLLAAMAGAAGGFMACGADALCAASHELLAAVEIARRLAGDGAAVGLMLRALAVDLAILREHRGAFRRIARRLERRHRLDHRELARLLRGVESAGWPVMQLLSFLNPQQEKTTCN